MDHALDHDINLQSVYTAGLFCECVALVVASAGHDTFFQQDTLHQSNVQGDYVRHREKHNNNHLIISRRKKIETISKFNKFINFVVLTEIYQVIF